MENSWLHWATITTSCWHKDEECFYNTNLKHTIIIKYYQECFGIHWVTYFFKLIEENKHTCSLTTLRTCSSCAKTTKIDKYETKRCLYK